jgi:hypothetical protein
MASTRYKTSAISLPSTALANIRLLRRKMKLVDKKIRKDGTYAAAVSGGVIKGSIKKTSLPSSASKSPTSPSRSSRRLQKEDPEAEPLHTWEAFGSKPADFIKNLTTGTTTEGVVSHLLWKINNITSDSKLWGFSAERKAEHFYPGQIIRAMDAIPQTYYDAPLNDPFTASHKEGPVFAKMRPMVVLWKTNREILCLPFRSLSKSSLNFDKEPERWQGFISSTTADDKDWKGMTPWAGPPLIRIATKISDVVPHKRSYIQLTRPISLQMQSNIQLTCGRLSGEDYCRMVEAYMYSQTQYKQEAFAEYGEAANLPDGTKWWEGEKPGLWQSRELRMKKKQPVVVDKSTTTYRLE